MARYIDADKLIEFITKGLNNPDKTKAFGYDAIEILAEVEYAPAADVAPKSEVAREIFEEIDTMIFGTIIPNDCAIISIAKLAELKKKYTEEHQ